MTNNANTVCKPRTLRGYTQRFAFTVGTATSMNLVSISGNLSHSLSYYARINYLSSDYAVMASLILVLAMCIGLALVALGFRLGPPLLACVAALNVLLSADYLGNHPVTLFALFPLLQSLLCLVILNTRNHRRCTSMLRVKRRRKIRANASIS
ncbi:hypothetical protein GCM10009091_10590 [Pseudomonas brenneri]|uniref:Uncharacterized protein n=2 Tax=Pseudomonas brenneri TaxID=129817 RepID=A0ABY0WIU6_9PSED|nr:hypothetical protein [Pseudomonas brenneri]GGL30606.1 hypothetical protein GCM10009091_10590 [Pseudomonas brenneri]SDV04153.1 hypothetical protein SAMN04490181_3500 [Pseudomonas brenneri]